MTKTAPIYCVVGSGLTGLSAAHALVRAGKQVLMLDVGKELEPEAARQARQLSRKPAWQWSEEERDSLAQGIESNTAGVKEKRLFGSDFSSRPVEGQPFIKRGAAFYSSGAKCGLGNIWGAGLLPMHDNDMGDWPISVGELEPHYRETLEFMPVAGQNDSLEKEFPLFGTPNRHQLSRQALHLLANMNRNAEALRGKGFSFGASRLAASFKGVDGGLECQNCGMCMYGCPYGILYSGSTTLDRLQKADNFTYRSGVVVQRLEQSGQGIIIHATSPSGDALEPIMAARVFLAAGPFGSTRIVLRSLGLYDRPVQIKTSEQFYMPLLSFQGFGNIEHEDKHTMCQAFVELLDPSISPFYIHFSIYTHNDLYKKALKNLLGSTFGPTEPLLDMALSRLYFAFCYLHSDHSATIIAKLQECDNALVLDGRNNSEATQVLKKIKKRLCSSALQTGLVPVPGYSGKRLPGAANHSGGSFPMRTHPSGLETDLMGQLPGFENLHIIDSSIFPSITATTMTYSVMANAHRIASLAGKG